MKQTKYVSKTLQQSLQYYDLYILVPRVLFWLNFLMSWFTAFCRQARKQKKLIAPDSLLEERKCNCLYECFLSVSLKNINLEPV